MLTWTAPVLTCRPVPLPLVVASRSTVPPCRSETANWSAGRMRRFSTTLSIMIAGIGKVMLPLQPAELLACDGLLNWLAGMTCTLPPLIAGCCQRNRLYSRPALLVQSTRSRAQALSLAALKRPMT